MSYKMNLSAGDDSSSFMSKIKSAGSAFSMTTVMYIVAAILFILIAVFIYYQYVKPSLSPSYSANSEKKYGEEGGATNEAELMFFYTDWCPHCKTAKPDWAEVKAEYENKTINGYHIIFTEINCTTESDEVEKLMNKYKIEGYPTIKLLKDGQIIEYDAKPSKDTIIQFLNTVL
jgi:thiol-disulfide isomerase/thioredoxin